VGKWLKNILFLAVICFLLWYLVGHWEQLKALFKLSPKQIFLMCCIWFLIALINARAVQYLLNALKTKTDFWDMVKLHHAALLLNYVPMKFGTVFRANYLKRHYGLAYTHFATFFLYITFLMTALAAIIGLVVLLTVYGLGEYEAKISCRTRTVKCYRAEFPFQPESGFKKVEYNFYCSGSFMCKFFV